MKKILGLALVAAFAVPLAAMAVVGVGVGTGKIYVNKPLKPGMIYELPPITVLNTGDEPSDYGLLIETNQTQTELRPDKTWFTFSPSTLHLEPGGARPVAVTLSLPLKVTPGDYFAYVEARPIQVDQPGKTRIGVAAASKLYFTVAPANIFAGVYYRAVSFLARYTPWTYIAIAALGAAAVGLLLRRFVSFNIGFSVRKK